MWMTRFAHSIVSSALTGSSSSAARLSSSDSAKRPAADETVRMPMPGAGTGWIQIDRLPKKRCGFRRVPFEMLGGIRKRGVRFGGGGIDCEGFTGGITPASQEPSVAYTPCRHQGGYFGRVASVRVEQPECEHVALRRDRNVLPAVHHVRPWRGEQTVARGEVP